MTKEEIQRLTKRIHAGLRDTVKDEIRWSVAIICTELAKTHIEVAEKEVTDLRNKFDQLYDDFRKRQEYSND